MLAASKSIFRFQMSLSVCRCSSIFFLNKLLSRPFEQIISTVALKFSGVPLTQNLVSDVATRTFRESSWMEQRRFVFSAFFFFASVSRQYAHSAPHRATGQTDSFEHVHPLYSRTLLAARRDGDASPRASGHHLTWWYIS